MPKPGARDRPAPTSLPGLTGSGEELVTRPKFAAMPDFGAVVLESRHAPGFFGQLEDPYAKFHLIIAGRARWEGGGVFTVGPNTLFHIAKRIPHRQEDLPGEPVTLYALHYRPELLAPELSGELSRLGMLALDLNSAQVNRARQVRSLFQEMLFEQSTRQTGWEMVLQSRLIDLAVLTLRLSRRLAGRDAPVFERGNDSAERVAHYALRLKTQFYRHQTLEEAARAAGLSRRQFTELFRAVTGQTWRKYVQRLRLDHAAKLLAETDKSVTAVAFECGFDDLSHFHHSFKPAFGCTPMAHREKFRPKNQS